MNDRWLISSFTASSLIHLGLIPVAALMMHAKPLKPITVPIELIDVAPVELPKKVEVAPPPPPPPPPKPKPKAPPKPPKITAPKLISKPEIIETKPQPPVGNTKEEIKEPEPVIEPPPLLAALPEKPGSTLGGWNTGSVAAEAEGSAGGAGNLFEEGDAGVVGGSGIEGGGGGQGSSGLGREAKGDGTGGGGVDSGEALSGLAKPLGGYQVKPRYPEAARRAGAQGVTVLKVNVLESGRVGAVLIEKSAGFRELDVSAMEAVKKWLFEPARRGKEPVSVWVMLPVKFELR
ncbi:MAG: TonB family protein [Deltaproteobacteria bacterium]|nr:TonB family protein [Deltaproteobacteria bacterium]